MAATLEDVESSSQHRRAFVRKLSETRVYADYQRAFTQASGLPLGIKAVESFERSLDGVDQENPFCALLAKSNKSCAACLQLQAKVEKEANLEPATLKCFAGMCDTSVPVRVGENLVAFLQTGQVLLHQPNQEEFSRITRTLLSWGVDTDLKRLEEAYFQTRVLNQGQYHAFIQLLSTFAEHLAAISNEVLTKQKDAEPEMISRARRFILDNYDEQISLGSAAEAVNTSAHYFCKMFKKATGLTFTEYLTRIRIEKAKNLLLNPHKRVSEIAYEVGFESLSQFNRSFKRIVGRTPSKFREESGEWDEPAERAAS